MRMFYAPRRSMFLTADKTGIVLGQDDTTIKMEEEGNQYKTKEKRGIKK